MRRCVKQPSVRRCVLRPSVRRVLCTNGQTAAGQPAPDEGSDEAYQPSVRRWVLQPSVRRCVKQPSVRRCMLQPTAIHREWCFD